MPKAQKTLFDEQRDETLQRQAPLAARMRPRSLEEFVGQEQIVGEGRLLRRAIAGDTLFSIILWGPPGTGKTTLARIVAETTNAHYEPLSAVSAGVADLRRVVTIDQLAVRVTYDLAECTHPDLRAILDDVFAGSLNGGRR